MWVTKLLIFPVEIRIFCPKMTKFGPKLAFFVNLGQAMQAYSMPCWWVGWWLWRGLYLARHLFTLYVFGAVLNNIFHRLIPNYVFDPLFSNIIGDSER